MCRTHLAIIRGHDRRGPLPLSGELDMGTKKKAKRGAPNRKPAKTRGARKTKAATGKAPNPAFAFLTDFMTRNPKAVYADAAAAAEKAGHKIYPLMRGRAQTLMGRAKSRPRGSGEA